MANPAWVKGCPPPNPTGATRYRDRMKNVLPKRSSLEYKISVYLTKKFGRLVQDMDKLSERDRVRAYLELLSYSTPKKAAVSADTLTAEQVEQLYDKITQMANAKSN